MCQYLNYSKLVFLSINKMFSFNVRKVVIIQI